MGVHWEFGLEADSQRWPCMGNGTHVEDMKDPVEIHHPSDNHFPIILRMKESGDDIPPALFDYFCLDPRYGSAIKSVVGELSRPQTVHHWFNPRRQLVDRLACSPIEVAQFLFAQPPVKGSTHVGAV